MSWIPLSQLAEIAEEINTIYSQKRSNIHDVYRSEDLLAIEPEKTIREALLMPRVERDESKARSGFHLSAQAYKATGTLE